MTRAVFFLFFVLAGSISSLNAQEPPDGLMPAQRGEWLILNKPFITADFDQETFDNLWKTWPEPLKSRAKNATSEQRRQMAFSRYGLTGRPHGSIGKPLQYVVTERGEWVMNCHSCHSGKVAGKVIPGVPNSLFAMQTLLEETRAIKPQLGKQLSSKEIASFIFPLGSTVGTTNAVIFGVALGTFRDPEMNLVSNVKLPTLLHHDMDAPAWWHYKKKKQIYIDGFAEKNHRVLMSFALVRSNSSERYRGFENDFRDISAYIESLEAPVYPYAVDRELASRGKEVFDNHCMRCHGSYGEKESYPERTIPIDEIGTDPVRLRALPVVYREGLKKSWVGEYGKLNTVTDPKGYVAPPLDGIWATAPYFHNGSVPTLWHVLHPEQRPVVWRRTEDGYDRERVGLEFESFDRVPRDIVAPAEKRMYFDTRKFGKKNSGHTYPNELDEQEKRAVLEYLKTI